MNPLLSKTAFWNASKSLEKELNDKKKKKKTLKTPLKRSSYAQANHFDFGVTKKLLNPLLDLRKELNTIKRAITSRIQKVVLKDNYFYLLEENLEEEQSKQKKESNETMPSYKKIYNEIKKVEIYK